MAEAGIVHKGGNHRDHQKTPIYLGGKKTLAHLTTIMTDLEPPDPPHKIPTSGTYYYHLIKNPALLKIYEKYYPIRSHRQYTYGRFAHTTSTRHPPPPPHPHERC